MIVNNTHKGFKYRLLPHNHIDNTETGIKHGNKCHVCGMMAYSKCKLCGVFLHFNTTRGEAAGKNCFFQYHDDSFFGLAKCDHAIANIKKSDWKDPSQAAQKKNRDYITRITNDSSDSEDE